MKTSYEEMILGLDQLFFGDFGMPAAARAIAIEAYLKAVGWTWDEVINHAVERNIETGEA